MSPNTCRDRACDPAMGDEGCLAHVLNENAHDGLDGVWSEKWNDCPLMAAERAEMEAREHADRQYDEWVELMGNAQEAHQ